ncbi:hypothetical protein AB4304_13945 [Vibrio breoganii]
MKDETYRKLMRKHKSKYHTLLNQDGIYVLGNQVAYNKIRNGRVPSTTGTARSAEIHIESYSLDGETLMLYMVDGSTRYMNSIIGKLGGLGGSIVKNANVDTESGYFHFEAKYLDEVADASGIKKKRQLTDEQRKQLAEQAKKNFAEVV